jgi:signal transduction histidine kinase
LSLQHARATASRARAVDSIGPTLAGADGPIRGRAGLCPVRPAPLPSSPPPHDAPPATSDASRADPERLRADAARGVSAHVVLRAGDAEARRRRARRWPRRSPLLVLAAALVFTLVGAVLVALSGRNRIGARFENARQGAEDRIRARLETYTALLYAASAFFAASEDVTAPDFARFVAHLDMARRFPGMRAIGYSERLGPWTGDSATAAARLATLRARGSVADRLWPLTPRDEQHAIVYLEPLDARNRAAIGYDMFSDTVRREAMARARDTGQPAASGAVTLVQEITEQRQRGFLVYLPIYRDDVPLGDVASRRAALRGFVYAAFRADDLFAGIFGSEESPRVLFRVFDGVDTTGGILLADSRRLPGARADLAPPPSPLGALAARPPQQLRRLEVGGRPWTIAFIGRPEPERVSRDVLALLTAIIGTGVSLALYLLSRAQVRARERAERSEAMRSRFFAAMSHELRTPINAILGYNDLLLAGVYGALPQSHEDGIRRSQRAARHLLELVNDVLDLSKLEAGKIDVAMEPVRLDELLEDLLTTIRPMAEERGCTLELSRAPCALSIRTDPRRLRQILLNLLSNATKFGAGHPVRIGCECLPQGAVPPGGRRRRTAGDAVVITVADGGPGIGLDDQERVFEEFVQLPGATPGGTGLGLPISRRLAELLGGTLTLVSTPGRGCAFHVTLPREPRRPARRAGA